MAKLIIWGASGHALVVADIVRLNGNEIAGFLDAVNPARHGDAFCGSVILGGLDHRDRPRAGDVAQLIGAIGDCGARMQAAAIARQKGFTLATAVHPRATVATDSSIGEGTVVAAGAVVNPGARIGSNV